MESIQCFVTKAFDDFLLFVELNNNFVDIGESLRAVYVVGHDGVSR